MKLIIALALVALANASVLHVPGLIAETGASIQRRSQDSAGNYEFAYNEQHTSGGSSRTERGDAFNRKVGTYTLNVADGRQRAVNYVADGLGFRASVATNEPGTKASIPANAPINAAPAVIAAPAVVSAPAVVAAAAPAVAPFTSWNTQAQIVQAPIVQKAIHVSAPVYASNYGIAESGASVQQRSQDSAGNFQFAYNEGHTSGGSYRREAGNTAGVVGEYGLHVADGRQRRVNYIADGNGFRASVATNEPGTKSSIPANAPINAAPAVIAAPIVQAPIVQAPIVQAPIVQAPIVQKVISAPSVSAFSSSVQHVAAPRHIVQAPIVQAAVAVPAPFTSYSSAVQHNAAAEAAVIAAPSPALQAYQIDPVPSVSSFSSAVQHNAAVGGIKAVVAAPVPAPAAVSSFSSAVQHNAALPVAPAFPAPVPSFVTAAPAVSSFSSAVQHNAVAAPAIVAAQSPIQVEPLPAPAAPSVSSFGSAVQHNAYLGGYKTIAAPIVQKTIVGGPALSYGAGFYGASLGAPILTTGVAYGPNCNW